MSGMGSFSLQLYKKKIVTLVLISSYKDATCLVTISEGKFFSLGMDLDYLLSVSGNEMTQIMADLQRLYCRLLTFPMVTVAAANGMIYSYLTSPYHRRLFLGRSLNTKSAADT